MQNLDEFKKNWKEKTRTADASPLDQGSWQKIVKQRANKQRNVSIKYFWAAFTLNIIVYAFLSHIIIRYWEDTPVLLISIFCLLLYVPFTVVLMRKFKRMAILKSKDTHTSGLPIKAYVEQQYHLLNGFYRFKKRYEIILIPLSSAILIWVLFRLYLPGGVLTHPILALVLYLLTLASCIAAIVTENKKRFKQPLAQLEEILRDMEQQ